MDKSEPNKDIVDFLAKFTPDMNKKEDLLRFIWEFHNIATKQLESKIFSSEEAMIMWNKYDDNKE